MTDSPTNGQTLPNDGKQHHSRQSEKPQASSVSQSQKTLPLVSLSKLATKKSSARIYPISQAAERKRVRKTIETVWDLADDIKAEAAYSQGSTNYIEALQKIFSSAVAIGLESAELMNFLEKKTLATDSEQ